MQLFVALRVAMLANFLKEKKFIMSKANFTVTLDVWTTLYRWDICIFINHQSSAGYIVTLPSHSHREGWTGRVTWILSADVGSSDWNLQRSSEIGGQKGQCKSSICRRSPEDMRGIDSSRAGGCALECNHLLRLNFHEVKDWAVDTR